jgi:hypothetical protein
MSLALAVFPRQMRERHQHTECLPLIEQDLCSTHETEIETFQPHWLIFAVLILYGETLDLKKCEAGEMISSRSFTWRIDWRTEIVSGHHIRSSLMQIQKWYWLMESATIENDLWVTQWAHSHSHEDFDDFPELLWFCNWLISTIYLVICRLMIATSHSTQNTSIPVKCWMSVVYSLQTKSWD